MFSVIRTAFVSFQTVTFHENRTSFHPWTIRPNVKWECVSPTHRGVTGMYTVRMLQMKKKTANTVSINMVMAQNPYIYARNITGILYTCKLKCYIIMEP